MEASPSSGRLDRNVDPSSPLRSRDLWCRASMHYRRASHRATNSLEACGRGAVGSAQPCQGWGRGFESRRPLDGADASTPAVEWPSGEATACKAVHTGSIPVSTSEMDPARLAQRESASLTRKRSLVQSQYRAPVSLQVVQRKFLGLRYLTFEARIDRSSLSAPPASVHCRARKVSTQLDQAEGEEYATTVTTTIEVTKTACEYCDVAMNVTAAKIA